VDLGTLWKLIGLGMEADFEKRTWSISAGPFKANGIKFITLKALSDDAGTVQKLLSDLFVKPAVMWMDFRRETVTDCINSLASLENSTATAAEALRVSHKSQDELLVGLLQSWSGDCKLARGRLETALKNENDPIDTGMDISARDEIAPALGDFRSSSLPAVKFLIDLLPETNPIKAQSSALMSRAEDELIRHYGVNSSSLKSPSVEPELAT
jgi:hypothetical protein